MRVKKIWTPHALRQIAALLRQASAAPAPPMPAPAGEIAWVVVPEAAIKDGKPLTLAMGEGDQDGPWLYLTPEAAAARTPDNPPVRMVPVRVSFDVTDEEASR